MAGQREQIPAITLMEMADIFGGVIDFILDPRLGDNFSLLFEEKYLDGEMIGTGEIIAAQFTNQGKKFLAVRYENEDGKAGFYNPEGESMRKAFPYQFQLQSGPAPPDTEYHPCPQRH